MSRVPTKDRPVRGALRKIERTVYDHQGRIFNVMECGHALYQRYRWVKGIFRRCPICGVLARDGEVPAWYFESVIAIDDAKEALLEGKRRLALAHFEAKGEEPPPILLKARYDHPLFEIPVRPSQRIHFRGGCGMRPGTGTEEEKILTDNPHEVTCLRCLDLITEGKKVQKKKAHYQDCDGQRLCLDVPSVRSDYPVMTTDMAEVTCAHCLNIIGRDVTLEIEEDDE